MDGVEEGWWCEDGGCWSTAVNAAVMRVVVVATTPTIKIIIIRVVQVTGFIVASSMGQAIYGWMDGWMDRWMVMLIV